MADAAEYKFVTYETIDDGTIARIMLDRVDARNAQNRGMLVELDDAFLRAEADDTVRVVILGGNGPMFSSGHDLGSAVSRHGRIPVPHRRFPDSGATHSFGHARSFHRRPPRPRCVLQRRKASRLARLTGGGH